MTTIQLAVLADRDMRRLWRAVEPVFCQEAPGVEVRPVVVVNTRDAVFREEAVAWCERSGVEWVATPSDGTAARGKNACLRHFLGGDADYLCQLDGDDFLYPTWAESVAEHLRRAPGLDVLALIPLDCIGTDKGHVFALGDGAHAGVWGTSSSQPFEEPAGPQEDEGLWSESPVTPAMVRLVSRRAARHARFDEGPLYEDYLMLLRYLAAHQAGALQVWLSMSSDWMVVDRLAPGSAQKCNRFDHGMLRALAAQIVPRWRSSVRELPVLYPPMIQTVERKEAWIRQWHIADRAGNLGGGEPTGEDDGADVQL